MSTHVGKMRKPDPGAIQVCMRVALGHNDDEQLIQYRGRNDYLNMLEVMFDLAGSPRDPANTDAEYDRELAIELGLVVPEMEGRTLVPVKQSIAAQLLEIYAKRYPRG